MPRKITNRERTLPFGQVRTTAEAGRLARAARRASGLTLDEIYAATSISTRFLSEFERDKPNASFGRVLRTFEALGLDVVIVPRRHTASVLQHLSRRIDEERG